MKESVTDPGNKDKVIIIEKLCSKKKMKKNKAVRKKNLNGRTITR